MAEEISSSQPSTYRDLYELDHHLEESQKLEIEALLERIFKKAGNIYSERQVKQLVLRAFELEFQRLVALEKEANCLQGLRIYLQSTQGASEIAGAILGSPLIQGFAKMISPMDLYQQQMAESKGQLLHYRSQNIDRIITERNQQTHSADQEHDKAASGMDRMIHNSRRISEMILGN
jgi:hypothetical protein